MRRLAIASGFTSFAAVAAAASAPVIEAAAPQSAMAETAADAATDDATRPPAAADVRGVVSIDPPDSLVPPNLSRVVVYLDSHPSLDRETREEPTPVGERPQIAQRNKAFVPDFLVVTIGTWVEFPNWDDFSHNVFSRSAAAPPFDLDRYGRGVSKGYQFQKVGVVQVFCNIHPRMRATVFVTPNDCRGVADGEGRFTIRGAPAGSYELVAWHPRCHERRLPIEIGGAGDVVLSITLDQNINEILDERRRSETSGPTRGLGVKRERLNLPVVTESHPACCPQVAGEKDADSSDDPGDEPASDESHEHVQSPN